VVSRHHLNQPTGLISGTPKQTDIGTYTFKIKVVEAEIDEHHSATQSTARRGPVDNDVVIRQRAFSPSPLVRPKGWTAWLLIIDVHGRISESLAVTRCPEPEERRW
jgi:hypothetical protein